MPNEPNFGSVKFGRLPQSKSQMVDDETPFRMLILGDFSGRGNRGIRQTGRELASRKNLAVDRDNFDEVMGRLDIRLDRTIVDSSNEPVSVSFCDLDDFEPDALFEDVALFESLRNLRGQLLNESTFAEAAEEVRSWTSPSEATKERERENTPEATAEISLGDLVDNTIDRQKSPAGEDDRWGAMIRQIVAPHITAAPDPQRDDLVACVDAAISQSMRRLLHHPDFQRLESAWRGLYLLIRRVETGRNLQVHILDISRAELAEDLESNEISETGLYRLVAEQSVEMAGGEKWSVILSCESFDDAPADVAMLSQLGCIAWAAGAPFIADATGSVVGCSNPELTPDPDDWQASETESKAWQALRQSEVANNVELLWPRFRGRMPYGAAARSIESFAFEEMESKPAHYDYLWCSPAFAAAIVLGQSFTHGGWNMRPGDVNEVDDLPLCIEEDSDGDSIQLPCGELWLAERAIERVRKAGVTPVTSIKDQAAIRVGSFRGLNGSPLTEGWT